MGDVRMDSDSDSDDIMLGNLRKVKAAQVAKPAAAAPPPVPKAEKPKPKVKPLVAESDSDDDVPLRALKKKSTPKSKPSSGSGGSQARVKPVVGEDSDDDVPMKRLKLKKKSKASTPRVKKERPSPSAKKPAGTSGKKDRSSVKKERSSSSSVKKERSTSTPKKKKRSRPAAEDDDFVKPATKPKRQRKATADKKQVKQLTWEQKVDRAIMSFKWWESQKHKDGARWESLEHCGVMFPDDYEPHGVKMLYDGEPVNLPPAAEELATFYAQVAPDGPQLSVPKIAKLFNANFFRDFKAELPKNHVIRTFSKCDFGPIRDLVQRRKEKKQQRSKAEKAVLKAKNQKLKAHHMYAFVDGHIEKLANCMVEPPNLFRGRGEHPRTGTFKRRVLPEDITINVAKTAVVPKCPMPGHAWKSVVHDPKVTWLATWTENVMGQHKYVFLAASSGFKGEADLKKYEKARRLKKKIDTIRRAYTKMLKSKDNATRQMGTAIWVIDILALRVGNEKDESEADTVGCCSLRVEHLAINEASITFDFLGKDSMRYFETIEFERYGEVGKQVLENFRRFCKGKKRTEDVFDKLTPTTLNKQLSEFMPGLSAKVFRTYNASVTLEKELPECDITKTTQEKGVLYDAANRQVAILCNHQRSVPKSFQAAFEKLEGRRDHMEKQIKELRRMKRLLKEGRDSDVPLKVETDDKEANRLQNHLFKRTPSMEQVVKRLASFLDRKKKLELSMKHKDDNKTVALGTSKINYMDPRITVAWCKRVACPIEKVFSRTLRDKFPWAMSVKRDFKF